MESLCLHDWRKIETVHDMASQLFLLVPISRNANGRYSYLKSPCTIFLQRSPAKKY